MVKGSETFDEAMACNLAVGGELASGWSQSAVTVALMNAMTTWLAARVMSGKSLSEEVEVLADYLSVGAARIVAEMQTQKSGAH